MSASQYDGDITLYEELGVAPDASQEEIRNAFRRFVRLLHPDQQTDPQLKETAEAQMRKLNRVYAVLSDPESRLRYDGFLRNELAPPIIFDPPSPALRRLFARTAWIGAIALCSGALIWLASENTPAVQSRTADPGVSSAASSTSAPPVYSDTQVPLEGTEAARMARLQADLRAVIAQRDAAIRELNRLRGGGPQGSAGEETRPRSDASRPGGIWPLDEPKTPFIITELPSAPKVAGLAPNGLPRIDRPANRKFAGFWFYSRPPQGQNNRNRSLYLPQYIEASITEEGSVIHGRYRSRFEIPDRGISPDVNFTFTGAQSGTQCNCQWTGAAGAKGDLSLRLTSENSMRIDWTASELGTEQGLSSGTAVLTRRVE
jgi:curved DNA-binding protein CbpA